MNKNLTPSWSLVKLGDIAEFKNGINFNKNQKGEKGVPTIDVYNMYSKGIFVELDRLYRVNKEINDDYKLRYGDILFVRSSVKREGIGFTTAFLKFSEDVTYCGFIIRARLDSEKLLPEFATYFFRTSNQRNKIISKAKQVTITNISQDKLSELTIPLPPLPAQKEIVAKIEELFSELDNGIEQLKKVKEQIKTYKQSVLSYAFSGRLIHESQRSKVKNQNEIQKAAEPEVDYGTSNKSNGLPEGWKYVKLGEILKLIGSGITPKGGRNVYQNTGIIFIRSQNVYPNKLMLDDVAYINEQIDEKMKRSRIKPNDVLLNITGASIGRATYIPEIFPRANVNQHVCILRFSPDEVYSKYISSFLNSPQGQSYINSIQIGATRQALNYSQINNFPVPLTSINEQHKIVEEIESRFSVADKLEQTIDENLKKSETLRQSILKQAFEGRLI